MADKQEAMQDFRRRPARSNREIGTKRQRFAWACIVPLSLALSTCANPGRDSGRYAGPSPNCPGAAGATASLVRQGSGFALAPADGAFIVRGAVLADGSLNGALVLHPGVKGPVAPSGGSHVPTTTISVSGRLDDASAVIDYAAGTCHAKVTLARVHPALL